ncbi:MAG: protein-L-isoaspartate(D-aspartate) O-methyltransferase [Elusimicrobiales bacterium]
MTDIIKKLSEKYQKYFEYLSQKLISEKIISRGITSPQIIDAIKSTPRHEFVPDNLKTRAYDDCAIEILPEQTISQPYIVALMIDMLEIEKNHKILEIGTGTGWQTCILSKLAKEVYSVDIRDTLYNFALERIKKYSENNVFLKIDDGFYGWKEKSPFDRIIVSCAAEKTPQPLIEQLSIGGIMIIPVGGQSYQKLLKIKKISENQIESEEGSDVVFVKMKRNEP